MRDATESTPVATSRTARFAQFLRAAVAIKTKVVTEVNKYPTVIWYSHLPADIEEIRSPLTSPSWQDDDTRWLVIKRVPEPDRPTPPSVCATWLRGVDLDSPDSPPEMNEGYLGQNDEGATVSIPPDNESMDEWAAYLDQEWQEWALKASVARKVKPFYQKLFATHQELQGRDDAYDLFIGVGLLDSSKDQSQRLHRHLLAFPAEITLDNKTGTLTVVPSAQFVTLRPEVDFLPTADRARLQKHLDEMNDSFVDLGPSFYDRPAVGELITRLVHALDSQSQYIDDLRAQDAQPGRARASFAPALILRPRSTRSLEELLRRIEKDATGTTPIPLEATPIPWRRMMEDERVWAGDEQPKESSTKRPDLSRVYFPLPSNEEQSRIVRFATGSAGVVVQGPPGTGKSHTIANLVSHYLACGQRVLVTAQTAQALEVLRDKMPPKLRQLCVTLLGNSRTADKDLRASVEGILNQRQEFDKTVHLNKIARLEAELGEAELQLVEFERLLSQSRIAETQTIEPLPGYRGTRSQIARRLRDEKSLRGWIEDQIPYNALCPTFDFGWNSLAEYHQALNEQIRKKLEAHCVVLPFTRNTILSALHRVDQANGNVPSDTAGIPHPPQLSAETLESAAEWLAGLKKVESEIGKDDASWTSELRATLLQGNLVAWKALRDEATEQNTKLTDEVVSAALKVEVAGRTTADARRDLSRLSTHYTSGGKRRSFVIMKPAVIKETEWLETSVLVDGAGISTPADVHRAKRALDGWALINSAHDVWVRWPLSRVGSPRQQVAALRHRAQLLNSFLKCSEDATALEPEICQWVEESISYGGATVQLIGELRRQLALIELRQARMSLVSLEQALSQAIANRKVVPALHDLLDGLKAESIEQVTTTLNALEEEIAARDVHQRYVKFLQCVTNSAPKLADSIVQGEGSNAWTAGFSGFEAAWQHRCVRTWMETILSSEKIEATQRASRDEKVRIQDVLSQLTASRAWAAALGRIDDRRRASLVAWAKAASSIPATGLSVFRKRAVAQSLLGQCLEVIPAWVVSVGRLYETVEAKPGLFDVAIVDEASQCWLDSLVLFYLAKQVIVVGDDKQISPTVVGTADGQIERLASAFLPDFEFRGTFTIDSSLFDHAKKYLSAGVPLREHFRCVPEIIRFSNELCYYDNPLIPLRQVGKNRLDPLKTTYIPNGMRAGDINDAEARAIVDAIAKCHEDPDYEESDFGVMCLQGDSQAERIQNLLLERLGPSVFNQRKLRCGNPYAFQGDERDVMFLSMVAAPNVNNASLTTTMYQQRFNVAMSRARDQAWLFHSMQEQELGPNCLRRRVLEFFKQPPDLTIHGSSVDTPTLQLISKRADRAAERPPKPFDSWFEVDVALALTSLGYTISAQVQVARKRIDLVVEGTGGVRLAVECDGEAWHGPEQYELDTFRQHQLERAGWRFARVRESLFYSDEEKAINNVIAACEELEIEASDGRNREANPPEEDEAILNQEISGLLESPSFEPSVIETDDHEPGLDSNSHLDLDESPVAERTGPFSGYGSKLYPDPRTAPAANVSEAVVDIIAIDGPLPKESLYKLYRNACPKVERAGKNLRQAVNRAVSSLERRGLIDIRDEGKRKKPNEVVVKLKSQNWVSVRPTGDRSLDDVPISEIATTLRGLRHGRSLVSAVDQLNLYRDLANRYGVRRVTDQAIQRLKQAEAFELSAAAV